MLLKDKVDPDPHIENKLFNDFYNDLLIYHKYLANAEYNAKSEELKNLINQFNNLIKQTEGNKSELAQKTFDTKSKALKDTIEKLNMHSTSTDFCDENELRIKAKDKNDKAIKYIYSKIKIKDSNAKEDIIIAMYINGIVIKITFLKNLITINTRMQY